MCMYVCHCVWVAMEATAEGIEFSGAQVTGSCELPDVGAGNGTWVLAKNIKC